MCGTGGGRVSWLEAGAARLPGRWASGVVGVPGPAWFAGPLTVAGPRRIHTGFREAPSSCRWQASRVSRSEQPRSPRDGRLVVDERAARQPSGASCGADARRCAPGTSGPSSSPSSRKPPFERADTAWWTASSAAPRAAAACSPAPSWHATARRRRAPALGVELTRGLERWVPRLRVERILGAARGPGAGGRRARRLSPRGLSV